ncbi:MAG: insulinase family protein [Acidobacteria bacterium]|nr:insulinase family protein [Acidobacteriota bacterium]
MSTVTVRGLSPVRETLANGATVLVQETAFSPAVTFGVSFRAGSLYEPDDLTGLSWLVGRVIDRGTATRSADAIAEALDDRGVSLRVSTNRHLMTVSCTCLAEDFSDVLALVADIARNPVFPQDQLEKRRAEVISRIRQDQDNPAVRAAEALQSLLYGADHPYGRPAKGTVDTIERARREDLVAYHAQRFAPASLVVVVLGDVNAPQVIDRVGRALDGWSAPTPRERAVPPVPAATSRRQADIEIPGKSQSDIAYGFTTIDRLDPRFYAFWVMNNILGQFGLGGRLAENIRERQGMAYYAFSAFDPSLGPGPLVIRAGVDPKNVQRAVAAIDAEVGTLGRDGPTERELAESRQYLIGSLPRMLETNESITTFLQTAEFFGLGLDFDRRLPSILQAVTMEEVRAAAADVLHPERATLAVAGPVPGEGAAGSST